MASNHRLLKLLTCGLFVSTIIVFSFFYGWDVPNILREYRTQQVHEDRQKQRKQLIKEVCDSNREKYMEIPLREDYWKTFLVDDNYRIIYCFVPKVACTNWKRFMYMLKHDQLSVDPNNITDDVHAVTALNYLWKFPKEEIEAKLKNYTKFMFVRDPFVRVISAYRNKFEWITQKYYLKYGREMLQRYGNWSNPPETAEELLAIDKRVTFDNFVQYLVDPRSEENRFFDEHWRQAYRMCHPCVVQYDFIGHLENLEEDTKQLFELLHLQNDMKIADAFPNVTTTSVLLEWFRTVSQEDRRKLYKLYEPDFKLFGYRKPEELFETEDQDRAL